MTSKFAAIAAAAGRLVRVCAARLAPPPVDTDPSGFQLPYWAYRKAEGDPNPRWHDLRKSWEDEQD